MRRLSETDLARNAVLDDDEQLLRSLRRLKGFRASHSLEFVRNRQADLFGVQPPMFQVPRAPDEQLLDLIARECRTDEDRAYCLPLARAMLAYRDENAAEAVEWSVSRWQVGYGQSVCYWPGYYFVLKEHAEFSYFDLRLNDSLTAEGRRFVLSLMHERLRRGEPDFEDAKLSILKAKRVGVDERSFVRYGAEEVSLMDRDELNSRIDRAYRFWQFVLEERAEEARKATGTGPLL